MKPRTNFRAEYGKCRLLGWRWVAVEQQIAPSTNAVLEVNRVRIAVNPTVRLVDTGWALTRRGAWRRAMAAIDAASSVSALRSTLNGPRPIPGPRC